MLSAHHLWVSINDAFTRFTQTVRRTDIRTGVRHLYGEHGISFFCCLAMLFVRPLTLKAASSAPTDRDYIVEILTILISNEQL